MFRSLPSLFADLGLKHNVVIAEKIMAFLDALASLELVIRVRGVRNFSRVQIMRYLEFD